ncbi:hypothetical protein ACF0H5_007900 [Mactra antiquata]
MFAEVILGGQCPAPTSDVPNTATCLDSKAICVSDGGMHKCLCPSTYYDSNGVNTGGGQCLLKKELGVYCPFDGACSDSNAICSNTKCTCKSGFYDNTGTSDTAGTCIEKKNLGFSCPNPSNSNVQSKDSCKDSFALCQQVGSTNTYTCTCTSSYYDNNGDNIQGGSCTAKVILGGQCPAPTSDVPNTATCLDSKAICVSDGGMHKCLCPSTYYDSNGVNTGGGQCLLKRQLGQSCQYNRACNDSNAICSGVCVCKSGFFDDSGTSNTGGTCLTKLSLGDVCPNTDTGVLSSEPCDDTYSTCQLETSTYRCRCTSDYYDDNGNNTSGGQCVRKVELGSVCPMQDACIKSNSQCVSDTCVCVSDYYDTNTANVSEGGCNKRKLLNAQCTERNWANYNRDQCSDQFAKCDSNGYCSCNTGYHQESSGCVANKANGDVCTGSTNDECSDTNSECRNGKCTCKTSYYDNNGQTGGGKCELINQLQVGSVVFSNIQTTGFTVSWSLPPGSLSGFVNYYTVRWTLINQENYDQSSVLSSSTTSYTVTGITPGKTYKVEIISRNTETEVNVERTTTVSKQQAAKPNMIKEITSSGNDLDVLSSGLTIRYTPGDGGKSGYNIRLFDGNTMIAEKIPGQSSTSVTIWNSNLPNNYGSLKHGYRYTVKIITKSESYDNGKKVQSDEFEAEVKTTPKLPNPPENGQCGNVLDSAITVSWDPPSVPNGDIVRYHVEVDQSSLLSTRSTDDGTTSLHVDGLEPGTSYHFRLITENEVGNSTASYYISTGCKTKAKMADAPQNLQISNISSRGFIVTWDVPFNLHSEENFGYVLQISDDTEKCVTRVLYKCSNCNLGNFSFSSLTDPCTDITHSTKTKTNNELMQAFSYTAELNPDILYTVTVSAINGAGQGYGADANKTTLEEAPQKPSITNTDVTSKSLTLTWNINGPRPGVTFYDIKLVPNEPANFIKKTVEGFNTRTFTVTGLEEFWDYNVSVIAKTSEGSMESDITSVQTLPAAPGKVSDFVATNRPGGIYTQIKVTWKAPTPLERNGIIKEYRLVHNTTQNNQWSTDVYDQHESMDYIYDSLLSVNPEMYYLIQVAAVNNANVLGKTSEILTRTPSGIPPNDVEQNGDIISFLNNVKQTEFSVLLDKDFFQQDGHGVIRATGLIGCITDKCNFNYGMSLSEFNSMTSWTISSQNGYTTYRITKSDWLDSSTRKKRQTTANMVNFPIGVDDCSNVPDNVYCNGPLSPGASYTIVAIACTSGGCLLSKPYGPFQTLKEISCDCKPDSCDSGLTAIIVGVVLGVIILVLLSYSGYVTLRLRRLSNKDQTKPPDAQQQPQYMNQLFLTAVSQSPDVENNQSSEDNYTSLNEESRDDKSTYETF